jgi:hypothetical protein
MAENSWCYLFSKRVDCWPYACNIYHNTSSVTDMLQTLTWPTLQQRRLKTKLIMFYKIVHHIVAVPTTILIPTDPRIRQFHSSSSSFGIQLSIHWMITSCCACAGIRNNNKFSQFITYLQVVPTEINFVVNYLQFQLYTERRRQSVRTTEWETCSGGHQFHQYKNQQSPIIISFFSIFYFFLYLIWLLMHNIVINNT